MCVCVCVCVCVYVRVCVRVCYFIIIYVYFKQGDSYPMERNVQMVQVINFTWNTRGVSCLFEQI